MANIIACVKHEKLKTHPFSLYQPPPHKYDTESQDTHPVDIIAKMNKEQIKKVQQILDGVLYHVHDVDCTVLAVLYGIVSK